jgi:hypothetical protein
MARTAKRTTKTVRKTAPKRRKRSTALAAGSLQIQEVESLRAEVDRLRASAAPPRWNANPDDVQRSVAKLVLTLVEAIRQLLERQAIRRMDAETLTPEQVEAIGLALMRLEETVRDLGAQFGLAPDDLNLDLGPIGKLV